MAKYLVSRNEKFIKDEYQIGEEIIKYNIWKRRNWPTKEVKIGDELYFFSKILREKKLKTEIIDVKVNHFDTRENLEELLIKYNADWDENYITEDKENEGILFLYKVKIIENLNTKLDIKLNMLGWERLD